VIELKKFEKILLIDRTTEKNILWATNDYNFAATSEIKFEQLDLIQPRYKKNFANKKNRTKNKAEVFTPTSVCDLQNNLIDESFGKISWQDYVSKKILEITCGEAPYLANRYDAVTGAEIEIENRVGMLDRKLKIISENVFEVDDWLSFAKKAVQSVYGYEFQGDNLFLARKNIFLTVQEFFLDKFGFDAYTDFLIEIAEIISWNLWQMDGKNFSVPFAKVEVDLFSEIQENVLCKIMDWQENKICVFKNIGGN